MTFWAGFGRILPVAFKIKFKNAEDKKYLDNWFRDLLEDIKIEYEIIEKCDGKCKLSEN